MIAKLMTFYRGRFYAHCRRAGFTGSYNFPVTVPRWSLYCDNFKSRTIAR